MSLNRPSKPIKRTPAKKSAAKRTVKVAPKRLGVKRKGIKIPNVGIRSFGTSKIKREDECWGPLDEASQVKAAEADANGTLFLWDGKLRCEGCGLMVGGKKSIMGDYYEPSPRPHARPKQKRPPARKRDPGKR